MRAVALVVLLAFSAHAADPVGERVGGPLYTAPPTMPDGSKSVNPPPDTPRNPLCLTPEDETLLAKHLVRLEAENAELRKGPALPTWALVLLGVGLVGVGFAVGYGVAKVTRQ